MSFSKCESTIPVVVDLADAGAGRHIALIGGGRNNGLLRFTDGRMAGWGDNASGQLGNTTTTTDAAPSLVDASGFDPAMRFMFAAHGSASQHSLAVAGVPAVPATGIADWLVEHGLTGGGDMFGDPDRDGISTIMEYAFGLDPLTNSAGQLPTGGIIDGFYVIRFTQPAGDSNIVYGAEWSTTLEPGSWADLPDAGVGSSHEFRVPITTSSRLFMRLKVAQSD